MNDYLIVVLLTLIPTLELRASIPYGLLATDIHWFVVFLLTFVVNVVLAPLLYFVLEFVVSFFRSFSWFDKLFLRVVARPVRRIKKSVDKWGVLGAALFIAVPLPGSGVYTASIGAYLLGISRRDFFLASVLGVFLAAVFVSIIVFSGSSLFSWVIKGGFF